MMACSYCIKHKWNNKFNGNNLKLEKEPSCEDIIASMGDLAKYKEIIFCGYGDPLIRFEEVRKVAKWIKKHAGIVRINTSGLANRYHGRNILSELKGFVDIISISLNGANPKEHNKINSPMYGEESFDEIVNFIKDAKNYIKDVVITAVKFPGFDISKVENLAKILDVRFRARTYLYGNKE
jgi:TatD DNase family protein